MLNGDILFLRMVNLMQIYSMGYNHSHGRDFVIDRPKGINSWLLLLIKTPAVFLFDGVETIVRANSFIIYTDSITQYYRTYGDIYTNDWIHFNVDAEDKELICSLDLPLNTVIYIGDISELSEIMKNMVNEYYSPNAYRTDIAILYLKMLLIKLSVQLHSLPKNSVSTKDSQKIDKFVRIRAKIYNVPQNIPDVDSLAAELSMSRSNFQHTYKKIFGTNVMSDIIMSRLQRSKYLLSTTNLTLGSIAEQCGYSNEFHLMRQFKEKFGMTPTEYRKINQ